MVAPSLRWSCRDARYAQVTQSKVIQNGSRTINSSALLIFVTGPLQNSKGGFSEYFILLAC